MNGETLEVTRLGQRGEGVAAGPVGPVFIPYALPDETVLADRDGDTGHLVSILRPRPDRVVPICPYFGTCGGCAVQALAGVPYAAWKRGLVVDALRKVGLEPDVDGLVDAALDAHGDGRRRATFHARRQPSPNVLAAPTLRLGFMRARAHEVIDIDRCPILASSMADALPAARALARATSGLGKPLDLVVTATESGLDIDLRGLGPLDPRLTRHLGELARDQGLARLANHGETLIERQAPVLTMGKAAVILPSGGFVQATLEGERALAAHVVNAVGSARKVADLFCGIGTFTLRLAERATVRAVDLEGPALKALDRAGRATPGLRPITTESRDLFHRPLTTTELDRFDAVVFDPPRAGASQQAEALAASKVSSVVAVSCNPMTFARDARILVGGGYRLERVTPIDQFRYSPHVEIVGVFKRSKARPQRALFG